MLATVRKRNYELLLFVVIAMVGLTSSFYLYSHDKYSLIYYGDAASHLVDSRKIVDWSENAGLAQVGTVWLPLPHFLLIPFVLVDHLFTTGFAGVAVSLPCLALSAVFLFRIIHSVTNNSYISLGGALIYALNPNILYMGITAMTEAPFMLFFVGGTYYFQRWYQNLGKHNYDLIKCAIFISLATFCRYEGWLIPVLLVSLVCVMVIKQSHLEKRQRINAIIISLISFSCITIWVIYNFLNYGHPFEFANAQFYSAAAQAANRPYRALLYLQPLNVAGIYSYAAEVVYGPILLSSAILSIAIRKRFKNFGEWKLLLFLILPPTFTILSLLIGIGEMAHWFNARFLILLSPLLIVAGSLFVSKVHEKINSKILIFFMLAVLFLSPFASLAYEVPTFIDAKDGFQFKQNPYSVLVGEKIGKIHDGGMIYIMTGSAQGQRIMVSSGIALKNFDEIIDSSTWKNSFKQPWLHDKWMIIGKSPDSDAINVSKYWFENQANLNDHYNLAYENDYYKILVHK